MLTTTMAGVSRDMLPDSMRELLAICDGLSGMRSGLIELDAGIWTGVDQTDNKFE